MKDDTRILSWSDDNTLRLWDAATGHQIGPTMKHNNWVSGALLTKDATRILSWGDHTLRLWDATTGQQIGPAMKHDDSVEGALLTKDETRILSWSFDGTLRLWDAPTGLQIGPAWKHDGPVTGALLMKDATRIVSWSDDHTLRLWNAWPKGNLLEVACALLPIEDRDASNASRHYGIKIKDPICTPSTATIVPGLSSIERAPAN
jgi:WD40 repeat protein